MSIVDEIKSLISPYTYPHQRDPALKQAAVLIGIVEALSGDRAIFNRRASGMNNHASEICLPGGALEHIDKGSHINAAVREAGEEIGLPKENIQVIGVLESCITSRNVEVTPVVAVIKQPRDWVLQTEEVEEVLELPLHAFLDAGNYKMISRQYRGQDIHSISIACNCFEIWGLTAKIMMRLQQLINQ